MSTTMIKPILFDIIEPRWHDKKVLLANWKIGEHNVINIRHSSFPNMFYIDGERALSYPTQPIKTKRGTEALMRVIPIDDLDNVIEEV